MCLDIIDKETKQVTEGWKIFEAVDNGLIGVYFKYLLKPNKWIEDQLYYVIFSVCNEIYKTGFHFYLDKKDAKKGIRRLLKLNSRRKLKIYKVKVKNITATGIQENLKIGVARKIFIEEELLCV